MKRFYKVPHYKQLSPEEALLLVVLVKTSYNGMNNQTIASLRTNLEKEGRKVCERSVRNHLKALANKGYITVSYRFEEGKRLNVYTISKGNFMMIDAEEWDSLDIPFYQKTLLLGLTNIQYKTSGKIKNESVRETLGFGRDYYKAALDGLLASGLVSKADDYLVLNKKLIQQHTSLTSEQKYRFGELMNTAAGSEALSKYVVVTTPLVGPKRVAFNDNVWDAGKLIDDIYDRLLN